MKEYTLNLKEDEVNTILLALAQRPYIEVADLIQNVREQAMRSEERRQCSE